MKELLQTLDRPIAFQRSFVRLTGSITAALMLSQAIYWSLRSQGGDGWFWKTMRGWEDETGLTRFEQEGARKLLRDLGVLREEKRGMPARVWFRVDEEILQARLLETSKQGCGKPANKVAGNRQPSIGTESTSETTAETTKQKQIHTPPLQAAVEIKTFEPEFKNEDKPWRDGWNGVMKDLQNVLLVNRPRAVQDRLGGHDDWRRYFEDMECIGVDRRGGTAGKLILRVPDAAIAQNGVRKYHKRIHAGMKKYFGRVVPLMLVDSS